MSLDGLLATTSASAISVFDMPRAMSAAGPWIAVIPMASARRQLSLTAALAWARLGARVHDVVPHRADRSDLEALAGSDVIVLLGGYPDRLIASLGASVIWDRVLDLRLGERPAPGPASPGRVTAGPALHHPAPEFA